MQLIVIAAVLEVAFCDEALLVVGKCRGVEHEITCHIQGGLLYWPLIVQTCDALLVSVHLHLRHIVVITRPSWYRRMLKILLLVVIVWMSCDGRSMHVTSSLIRAVISSSFVIITKRRVVSGRLGDHLLDLKIEMSPTLVIWLMTIFLSFVILHLLLLIWYRIYILLTISTNYQL